MKYEAVLNDIESLPLEKQEEVFDFIAFLKNRATKRNGRSGASSKSRTRKPKPGEFFGMWADRESMKDSEAWVRQLRLKEWER